MAGPTAPALPAPNADASLLRALTMSVLISRMRRKENRDGESDLQGRGGYVPAPLFPSDAGGPKVISAPNENEARGREWRPLGSSQSDKRQLSLWIGWHFDLEIDTRRWLGSVLGYLGWKGRREDDELLELHMRKLSFGVVEER